MTTTVSNALLAFDGGALSGFRNRIINGAFRVNQRNYASGAATTVGQYTLDRWKVTTTAGVTFATANGTTTVTIPAGQTIQQVIEGLNLEAGSYVLSWTGTAQGRIGAGAFGTSGNVTATTIEFNAGTVTSIQLERGTTSTPFERRSMAVELALCQRYYETGGFFHIGYNTAGSNIGSTIKFAVAKRATPTITQTNSTASNISATPTQNAGTAPAESFVSFRTVTATGAAQYSETWTASAEL